jgi:hypothetical protein
MSRQDVESSLIAVRDSETSMKIFSFAGFALFGCNLIVNISDIANSVTAKSGELVVQASTGNAAIAVGAGGALSLGIGIVCGLQAISYSQTAAVLEGVLAQDQLNVPDATTTEASPEAPTA